MRRSSSLLGVTFVLASCATPTAAAVAPPRPIPEPAAPKPEPEPEPNAVEAPKTSFSELEQRLAAGPLRLRFEATATGAFEASLAGVLSIGDEIELRAAGRFGDGTHDLRLWTQGDRLYVGPRDAPTLDVPRPPELAPALVIGLTRMGVLHNLARLVATAAPDHADGGVTDWVQTTEHAWLDDGEALRFAIVVAGQRTAEATLWLDARGLPQRREQTVVFPGGQMQVVERYDWREPPSDGG